MSLSWRSELRLGVHPDRIAALQVRGVWRKSIQAEALWSVPECAKSERVKAVVDTISSNVASAMPAARATVVLSNRWAHFAHIAVHDGLNARERDNYVRHKFKAIFGDVATTWMLRINSADVMGGVIVSAVEAALVEGIRSALTPAFGANVSIQPHFSAAFNRIRAEIHDESAWLVVQESKQVVMGRLQEGRWESLASRHVRDTSADALFAALEREHALQAFPRACHNVYLYPAAATALLPAFEHPRYKVRIVTPRRPDGFPLNKEQDYAVAA